MTGRICIPEGARTLLALLERGGYAAYVVGGCVRDSLLGRTPQDWDLCTAAPPARTRALLEAQGIATLATGLRHGTVTARMGPLGDYEVTTFRVDGPYGDHRHPDAVTFVPRVEQDLARRDFTVNAMAYHPRAGLIDPFRGAEDLSRGVIACVGDPAARFDEDALRMVRALRFAAVYGFAVAPETAAAIHRAAPLLDRVAGERLWAELQKLLCGPGAAAVLRAYPDVLSRLLPDLGTCAAEDYARAAAAAARYPGSDMAVKLALLLDSAAADAPGLDRLRLDRDTREETLALLALRPVPLAARSAGEWLRRVGPDRLGCLLDLREAQGQDVSALRRRAEELVAAGACYTRAALAVSGRELQALGIPPGRSLGRMLDRLLEAVVSGALENRRDALLAQAAAWRDEPG